MNQGHKIIMDFTKGFDKVSMRGSRGGGRGSGPTLENHKTTGLLSNTGPESLEIIKLPSEYSILGHTRPASKTPFKWRFAAGPMAARF